MNIFADAFDVFIVTAVPVGLAVAGIVIYRAATYKVPQEIKKHRPKRKKKGKKRR